MYRQPSTPVLTILVAGVLAVGGCEGPAGSQRITAPTAPAYSSAGPVVRSVTGTGHIDVPVGDAHIFRSFAFTALEQEDGTVGGQFEFQARHVPIRVHGRVTCLTIIGNAAWLGGVVEHSSTSIIPPGTPVRWRVVDNGTGQSDPPDLVSGFGPAAGGNELAYCEATPAQPVLLQVARGNLRVRG